MKFRKLFSLIACIILPISSQTFSASYDIRISSPLDSGQFVPEYEVSVSVSTEVFAQFKVARLWVDGAYYAIDDTTPFEFTVLDLAVGDHTLMVRAKDLEGNTQDSEIISITVEKPAPYTLIISPANGMVVAAGEQFTVQATAFDSDGIGVVRLWIDGGYHSLDSTAPFEFTVDGLSNGLHTLMVKSKDGENNLLASEAINITVLSGDNGDDGSDGGDNANATIELPIEVLGPAGTKKSVSFEINDTSNISHLYLRCNACGYHNLNFDKDTNKTKATVRINGGPAIALKQFTEKRNVYGNENIDIIGGGFRTVRMMVPVAGLIKGENTLTFEHLDGQAPSIGFRILELNLLENADLSRKVLNNTGFVMDDPSYWNPPLSAASDIAQGNSLWNQRNKLYDIWLDGLDGQGNGQGPLNGKMNASCADCHASDGRDLKYFNYSNLSIIERSKFHGLTQVEGEQIASYIRDLDIPIVAQARPWNPPYQPVTGLDSRPAYEWAAGAGVDAILDRDKDMAPYLLPQGTSLEAVRNVVDRYDTLNFRELPINMPMPE
jgi:hypothetical protein